MGELSIKVSIANRVYPLKVVIEDEENVRKAAKLINDKIKDYEENYSVRDKQDLLAMCALQLATESINKDTKALVEDDGFGEKILSLDQILTDYLAKK
jgi:cell division protein ZapA (FtsZ GTPase activity inhibitor)